MDAAAGQTPRVSVVIATYNWSSVLRYALESVLWQTWQDFEVLVIGDACTDDSAEVVASFNDPRLHWHNLPANSGSQSAPNNAGIGLARGEYIAYLGHDDIWYPTHLAGVVAAIEREQVDLAHSLTVMIGPAGSGFRRLTGVAPVSDDGTFVFVPPSSVLHRRDLIDRIGPWRDYRTLRLPPDYDLLQRAWQARPAFASSRQLTVFKFNSALRRNSYRERRSDEQAAFIQRIRSEPTFLQDEYFAAMTAYAGRMAVEDLRVAPDALPGSIVARNRAIRGLDAAPTGPPTVLRVEFGDSVDGLGWYPPEPHATHGAYRWLGPGAIATLQCPVAPNIAWTVRVCVVHAIAADIRDQFQLFANGYALAMERQIDARGVVVFEGAIQPLYTLGQAGSLRLGFVVNRTVRPCDVLPDSSDQRLLGLAVSWVELLPVAVT
jgi:hypothetical protein